MAVEWNESLGSAEADYMYVDEYGDEYGRGQSGDNVIHMEVVMCMDMSYYVETFASFRMYATFSFLVNGVLTTLATVLGCVGNVALYRQVTQLPISRRLTTHLRALSFWDSLLLMCSFLSHGILPLAHGIAPLYGKGIYLMYVFHPIGSVSVTGTLWQVVAITIERYLAVTRPFETLTRARCDVLWICMAIVLLASAVNLPTFLLEKKLETCVEIGLNDTFIEHVQVGFTQLHLNYVYTLLCHFLPDLLFRCPVPFLLIATCTVFTVQKCRSRTVGAVHITASRTVPVMLTLLNVKFLVCNAMYMFNTSLDMVGFTNPSSDVDPTEASISPNGTDSAALTPEDILASANARLTQFIYSLYLTDLANILLVLHSSTNWLLFFRWPSRRTLRTSRQRKCTILRPEYALQFAQTMEEYGAEELGIDLLVTVAMVNRSLLRSFKCSPTSQSADKLRLEPKIQKQGQIIGKFLLKTLREFHDGHTDFGTIRGNLRQIGCIHQHFNIVMRSEDWQVAKQFLTDNLISKSDGHERWWGFENPAAQFASFIIAEIKLGFLCEMVQVQAVGRNMLLTPITPSGSPQVMSVRNSYAGNGPTMGSVGGTCGVAGAVAALRRNTNNPLLHTESSPVVVAIRNDVGEGGGGPTTVRVKPAQKADQANQKADQADRGGGPTTERIKPAQKADQAGQTAADVETVLTNDGDEDAVDGGEEDVDSEGNDVDHLPTAQSFWRGNLLYTRLPTHDGEATANGEALHVSPSCATAVTYVFETTI